MPSKKITDLRFENILKLLSVLKLRPFIAPGKWKLDRKGRLARPKIARCILRPLMTSRLERASCSYRRSLARFHIAHSRSLPFPITSFFALQLPPLCVESVPLIRPIVSDSSVLFQDLSAALLRLHAPYCSVDQVQDMSLTSFSRIVDYCLYYLLDTKQYISIREAWRIRDSKERVVGLYPTLRNFTGEKPIALRAFLANLKYTFGM